MTRFALATLCPGCAGRLAGRRRRLFVISCAACWSAQAQQAALPAPEAPPAQSVVVTGARTLSTALSLDLPNQTGSRLGLELRDLPASVSVVTQEQMQVSGARTALEAVRSAVGMTGGIGVGSIPSYVTRGFAGNDVTIMRDGIRQNTSSQASRPLDSFLFDRIEVLKGPASLMYGEGAIGGAVNYVSKRASDKFNAESVLSVGPWGNAAAAVGAGGPTGVAGVSFRADFSHRKERLYVERSGARYDALGGELAWQATADTRISLSGTVLDDSVSSYYGTPVVYDAVIDNNGVQTVRRANTATDRLVNARIDPATRRLNYNNLDNFAQARNSFWRLVAETQLSPEWSLRNETYAATQRLDWRNTETTVWNPVTGLVDRFNVFLIFRRDLQVGNRLDLTWNGNLFGHANRLVVGALYDHNDQDRNSGQPGVPPSPTPASVPLIGFNPGFGPPVVSSKTLNVVTKTSAVYIENAFDLNADWKLIGGLRYDRITLDRTSFIGAAPFAKQYGPLTGRVGTVYTVAPQVNVYASYSYAAQPVSQLVSLAAAQSDFSLQKGRQWEAGIKATGWDSRADLTVALFDITKRDLLTSEIVNGVRINSQIGAQVSQGMEFEAVLRPAAGWSIEARLATTWKAEFQDFNENLGTGVVSRSGNTPPNVPKRVAGLSVLRTWAGWRGRVALEHVGVRQANNNNGIQLKAYTTLGASIEHRWDRLSLTLRGRNLSDRVYEDSAAGGGLMRRLADPRSVELGLRYEF